MPRGIHEAKDSFTSAQVAKILKVHTNSVKKWADDGKLEAARTAGGHRRFERGAILAFLEEQNMTIPSSLIPTRQRCRLLIVDDDKLVMRALIRGLKKYAGSIDYRVALTGDIALGLVHTYRPDVMLLDISMPNVDGYEVCMRLKLRMETRPVAVIMMTGHEGKDAEARAYRAGAVGFLVKPIDVEAFCARVISICADRDAQAFRA